MKTYLVMATLCCALALLQSGCSHPSLSSNNGESERRIASYQSENNFICSIRRPDGSLFTEYSPANRDRVRDLCGNEASREPATSTDCSGAIYCKKLVPPNGDRASHCSLHVESSPNEVISGVGTVENEAKDAALYACIQHHTYSECGAVAPSCSH